MKLSELVIFKSVFSQTINKQQIDSIKTMNTKTKTILFVTCPKSLMSGANPALKLPQGRDLVKKMQNLLPAQPPLVYVGTGKRHYQMWTILGFSFEGTSFTTTVGGPEIRQHNGMLLADGQHIELAYCSNVGLTGGLLALLAEAPDYAVVICDQHLLFHIGEPAALYDKLHGKIYLALMPDQKEPLKCSDIGIHLLEPVEIHEALPDDL